MTVNSIRRFYNESEVSLNCNDGPSRLFMVEFKRLYYSELNNSNFNDRHKMRRDL